MIKVLLFAQFRERLGIDSCDLSATGISNVADVISQMAQRLPNWHAEVAGDQCLCAVNQTLVSKEHSVVDGDEVAFFPPVTGG